MAALVHDASLSDQPARLEEVAAAAGIALENARLQAELQARLLELKSSRARAIEAADAERRRLERNLHDGAQGRLVALSLELHRLDSRLAGDAEGRRLLEGAREELAESLQELREIARGLHPAALDAHGLEIALDSLATGAPLPVKLRVDLPDRLQKPTEVAAFYLVSEALTNTAKYARASSASVDIHRENGHVVVEVTDDGVGGADTAAGSGLRGLADRVEALNGSLRVWSPQGAGTRVRAEIPCE
jgi:signal transduction histidine kinase